MSNPTPPEVTVDISVYRNQAVTDGLAGITNPSKTLLMEHMPACVYEVERVGAQLSTTYDADVWYAITGSGTISYYNKNLSFYAAVGATSNARAVLNTTAYAITSNLLELTTKVTGVSNGTSGTRYTAFGFASSFGAFPTTNRAVFYQHTDNTSRIGTHSGSVAVSPLLGRDITTGDTLTVRLDRDEGNSNINIARFYVDGVKIYESTDIPTASVYAGIGVFGDAYLSASRAVVIDYINFKYVR